MAGSELKRALAALAIGGATLVFGGAAVGTAVAQQAATADPTDTSRQAPPTGPRAGLEASRELFLAAVANKLNVTPDQLKQAMADARQELGIPDRPAGPGGGPGRGAFGPGFEAAAKAIGISVDQLRQELPGKSLADLAKAHDIEVNTVADALKAEASDHLDQAVSAGRLTAEQAAQMKQGLATRIDQMMTRQLPADAPIRGGHDHGPAGGPAQGGSGHGPAGASLRGGPRF